MQALHDMIQEVDTVPSSVGLELYFLEVMRVVHHAALGTMMFHEAKNDSLVRFGEKIFKHMHALIYDSINLSLITAVNDDSAFKAELAASMEKMSKVADAKIITGVSDYDYATLMIPHHEFVISICNSYLKYGIDTNIRDIAQEIITVQNMEILELSNWLIANKLK